MTCDRESREFTEKFLEKLEDAICGGLWVLKIGENNIKSTGKGLFRLEQERDNRKM